MRIYAQDFEKTYLPAGKRLSCEELSAFNTKTHPVFDLLSPEVLQKTHIAEKKREIPSQQDLHPVPEVSRKDLFAIKLAHVLSPGDSKKAKIFEARVIYQSFVESLRSASSSMATTASLLTDTTARPAGFPVQATSAASVGFHPLFYNKIRG